MKVFLLSLNFREVTNFCFQNQGHGLGCYCRLNFCYCRLNFFSCGLRLRINERLPLGSSDLGGSVWWTSPIGFGLLGFKDLDGGLDKFEDSTRKSSLAFFFLSPMAFPAVSPSSV
jgi:hypothetical protein